jgi:hypothetical protein
MKVISRKLLERSDRAATPTHTPSLTCLMVVMTLSGGQGWEQKRGFRTSLREDSAQDNRTLESVSKHVPQKNKP